MSQRIRRLRDWATQNLSGVVLEKVLDLCAKSGEWSLWYDHENAHTTSNMLDRLMRQQNGYFDRGQHFHGDLKSANLRSRLGDFAQLLAVVTGVGRDQRRSELSRRTTQRQTLQRQLARKPTRRRVAQRY